MLERCVITLESFQVIPGKQPRAQAVHAEGLSKKSNLRLKTQ